MPKRVLVVDDEPNIVMSLRYLMERAGFEVEVAPSGPAALEASRSDRRILCCST